MLPVADFAIITACFFGLYYGTRWIVTAGVGIARKLGLSDMVTGLTVVAIGTSTPEFAVAVSAVFRQETEITMGTVVGSNIINMGYILGAVAFFAAIPVAKRFAFRDGVMLVATTILLAIFFFDGHFWWWEGAIFLLILFGYMATLVASQNIVRPVPPITEFEWGDWPWFLLGSILVVGSSNLFVGSAINVAEFFDVKTWVVGVTLVALGTSLPEIFASRVAIQNGRPEISAGNLIGSNLFNLLGVMGIAGVFSPMGEMVLDTHIIESSWTLLLLMGVVLWVMFTGWEITRREGIVLFALAVASWVFNFSDLTLANLF